MPMNQQILLASRPDVVARTENFRLVETPVPQPGEGQVLLRTCTCRSTPTCVRAWTT